jgi:hypothetical protein
MKAAGSRKILKRGLLPGVESDEDEDNDEDYDDLIDDQNTSSADGENDE